MAVSKAKGREDIRQRKISIINQSTTPSPLAKALSLNMSSKVSVKLEVFPHMGQGLVGTMSKTPDYLTSLVEKLGRSGLPGLMILPPAEGGTKKSDSMYCCLKCKGPQVIMFLMN